MHGYSCLKMSLEYTFAIQTNICKKTLVIYMSEKSYKSIMITIFLLLIFWYTATITSTKRLFLPQITTC